MEKIKPVNSGSKKGYAPILRSAGRLFKKQWYLKSPAGSKMTIPADVNATEAWKITKGKPEIVVAIIDGGFDLSHPAFSMPGKIVYPANYAIKRKSAFAINDHCTNHGTMCAGIAVAESKTNGISGIANNCSFMPVCIPPDANNDLMIKIFEETAVHAHVICCSWSPPPVYAPLSESLYRTLNSIAANGGPRKKGVVICFSASNYNAPVNDAGNKQFFWFDKQTGSFKITRGPILNGYAAHPSVITVSASTSLNKKAVYSNWGKEISVCAPSNNFHPLVQESKVKGHRDVWTTDNNKGYTGTFGGTSAATALVAGIAALVLSVNPNLAGTAVKQILQDTADKIKDPEPDMILGECGGTYINGHSRWFGYGKINAASAVIKAKKMISEHTHKQYL